ARSPTCAAWAAELATAALPTKIATATTTREPATTTALRRKEIVDSIQTAITRSVCRWSLLAAFEPDTLLEIHRNVELPRSFSQIPRDHLIRRIRTIDATDVCNER